MIYSSIDNDKIKELKKLHLKKYRDKKHEFLIETPHLVLEAFKTGYLKELILEENEVFPLDVKTINVPFTFSENIDGINVGSTIETHIDVQKSNFINEGMGKVNLQVDLEFTISSSNMKRINVIDEIETNENEQEDNYSMVIYFVKKGDTLWKIAKEFKSTVDDIKRVNGIENENVIDVGKQLFIPRYSAIRTA